MPTLPDGTGLALSREMEPLGVIGPVYMEKMGCPHLRLNLQNPRDVFWNTLG